ncbi:MAG: hypothetical protein IT565_14055 [Rhodospirillales bacterium]|nr:hypothetical protein [Rhodospirillales bacterium]
MIKWLFDVTTWFNAIHAMVTWVLMFVASHMPVAMGTVFASIATWLTSIPITKAFSVGLWLLSPLVDPNVLMACVFLIVYVWWFAFYAHMGLWIIGFFFIRSNG